MKINDIIDSLERHPVKKFALRENSEIEGIILHHSATITGSPQAYARHHVKTRNWPGIGYHYEIAKDGTINKTAHHREITYHCAGKNQKCLGIIITGDYDKDQPPGKQIDSLVWLVKKLRLDFNKNLYLEFHRDHSPKSCPGTNISKEYILKITE